MRSQVRKRMLCALLVAAAAAVNAGAAFAYLTGFGAATGTGTAVVGTLKAPDNPQATAGAGAVDLSWPSDPPPAPGSVSYYVSRDGTPVGGSCGDPTSPISGTSCTDSGLGQGSYSYAVTAVWRSWTARSSPTSVSLSSGAAAQIVLAGSTDDLTSGSTRQLTATVEDAEGNTVSVGPDGGISIGFQQVGGTGSVTGLGSATAAAGVATETVTGGLAGTVDITASGTLAGPGSTTSNTLGFAVVSLEADAVQSVLAPTSSSITADGTSTQLLTVQAKDANGDNETTGGATVTIRQQSGTGTIGPVTDNGDGTYTATVTAPTSTGSGVFVATLDGNPVENGGTTQTQATVDYVSGPAEAAQSTLAPTSSSITANGTSTQLLTVQAKDANGNDETGGGATVTITNQSGTGTIGPVTDNGDGTYTATVTAPSSTGSGVFVATLDGNPVDSGETTQTQATVQYVSGPAVGIVLSNETVHPSPDVACSGPVGSIACSSYGEPNVTGQTLTAMLTLVDQSGNPVDNPGADIGIDLSASGDGSVAPSGTNGLTIPTGASTTSSPFTATRRNGNNKTLTVTAAVDGTGRTLTLILSSADGPDGHAGPAPPPTTTDATSADTTSTDTAGLASRVPASEGLGTTREVLLFVVLGASLLGLAALLTMPIPRRRARRGGQA